jgi:hypothetical protein
VSIEEFLARLECVRASGGGWMARCPTHADRNPSLSIHKRDGKILIKCFAGCSSEAVCAALGIDMRELSSDSIPGPRIVATYAYKDENRKLLFEVLRYERKSFRQRRPDGKGGWHWNMNGVRRVLYQLPEILAEQSLLVCEGEKDCETARALGMLATCNPGGAGKWREEYSESLRGKQITIIADADEPGRKHAQQVAESLHLRAESVKVLELPGAKDLSEWVERGGTRDSLREQIGTATKWKPLLQTTRGGFFLTPLRDLLSEPEEKVSWLLADKLPAGGISILSAKPKVGKSTLARCLALAVARGEPFLGSQTTQGAVIYLALEEKRSEVRRHFADLGATGEEPINIHCAAAPKDAMPELCKLVAELKPALVIIDPLFKFVRVADEKAYAETCQAIEPLLTLARETGAHVMLVHHSGKAERADATDAILGSTAIFGGVDAALILKRTDRYRTLQSSQRYGSDWPETVLEFDAGSRSLSLGAEKAQADVQTLAGAILEYLKSVGESKTEPEIGESVEGKTGPKRKALRGLVEGGKIVREGTGNRGDAFRYRFSFPCSPYIAGTREQEMKNGPEPRINTGDILVPDSSADSIHVPGKKLFEEGDL